MPSESVPTPNESSTILTPASRIFSSRAKAVLRFVPRIVSLTSISMRSGGILWLFSVSRMKLSTPSRFRCVAERLMATRREAG